MKRNILYILLLLLIATACSDQLEEDPKGKLNENFLKTKDGLNSLVISQYSKN